MEFAMNDLGEAAEDEEDFNQLNDETFGEFTHYEDFPYEFDESRQDYDSIFVDDIEENIKLNLSYLVLDDDDDPLNQKIDGSTANNIKASEWSKNSNNMLPGLDIWGSPAEENNLSLYKNYSSFQKEKNSMEMEMKENPPKLIMTLEELEKQLLNHAYESTNSSNFSKIGDTANCPGLVLDNKGLTVQEIERLFMTNKNMDGKENQPRFVPNHQYHHSHIDSVQNLDNAHLSNNKVSNMNVNLKIGDNLYNQVGNFRKNYTHNNSTIGLRPNISRIPQIYNQQINNLNMTRQVPPHLLHEIIRQRMNFPFPRFSYNGNQPNFYPHHNFNFYTHPNLNNLSLRYNQPAYRMPQAPYNNIQMGRINQQWNGEIPCNQSDEYAGLMTDSEKKFIIKIQLTQLCTNNPHIDDYYYTTFMLKRKLQLQEERNEEVNGTNIEVIMPQFSKPENKPYEPVKYEGALGRLTASNLSAPRQIINVLTPTNEEPLRTDVKKLKLTLIKIEKKFDILLTIEDQEKQALGLPSEQREDVLKDRSHKLNSLISEIVDIEDEFNSFINIRKGILLICRILPLSQKPKNLKILLKLFGKLANICKKEINIEILTNIARAIIFCYKNMLTEDLIIIGENFASLFQNISFTNHNLYYKRLILTCILALITFIEKSISLKQFSYSDFLENYQWQESISVIMVKLISLEEIHLDKLKNTKPIRISKTTFNVQLILSHLEKMTKNNDEFRLIQLVIPLLINILT